ncbi:hypothetical protein CPC08DRAFT_6977 [Agrocybe pediades]|nr:hypothetical protein CPC08DRAFT_6977 [Agrocybe pediades]
MHLSSTSSRIPQLSSRTLFKDRHSSFFTGSSNNRVLYKVYFIITRLIFFCADGAVIPDTSLFFDHRLLHFTPHNHPLHALPFLFLKKTVLSPSSCRSHCYRYSCPIISTSNPLHLSAPWFSVRSRYNLLTMDPPPCGEKDVARRGRKWTDACGPCLLLAGMAALCYEMGGLPRSTLAAPAYLIC